MTKITQFRFAMKEKPSTATRFAHFLPLSSLQKQSLVSKNAKKKLTWQAKRAAVASEIRRKYKTNFIREVSHVSNFEKCGFVFLNRNAMNMSAEDSSVSNKLVIMKVWAYKMETVQKIVSTIRKDAIFETIITERLSITNCKNTSATPCTKWKWRNWQEHTIALGKPQRRYQQSRLHYDKRNCPLIRRTWPHFLLCIMGWIVSRRRYGKSKE